MASAPRPPGGPPADMPVDSPRTPPGRRAMLRAAVVEAAAGREGRAAGQVSARRRRRAERPPPRPAGRREGTQVRHRALRARRAVGRRQSRPRAVGAAGRSVDPALKNVIAGVQATERELQSVLERHGVTRIEAIGKPFNAEFHQAMMEVEDPSVPDRHGRAGADPRLPDRRPPAARRHGRRLQGRPAARRAPPKRATTPEHRQCR